MASDCSIVLHLAPAAVLSYLDPGSGSMLFSAIVGIVATLFFVARSLFFKLVGLSRMILHRSAALQETNEVVFYSEGARYWNVFSPVLEALDRRGIRCTYLSSESSDPGLKATLANVEARCIGDGYKAFFALNTLRANVFVATTPGLEVLQLKRSKGVDTYCHITHSAGGCAGYSTYGLDYYDIVLVGGHGDKQMIEELERARQLPPKRVEIVGCTYLDALRQELARTDAAPLPGTDTAQTVLVSPTWGKHGLLSRVGDKLIEALVKANCFNVIVRPHPQSLVSESALIGSLTEKYAHSQRLVFDREISGLQAMRRADVMISDFSGIIFDFLFLFEKPVLAFKSHYDKRGKDAMDLADEPWNIRALQKLKGEIDDDDIDSIPERIRLLAARDESFSNVVFALKQDMDQFPGESGAKCADAIVSALGKHTRRSSR